MLTNTGIPHGGLQVLKPLSNILISFISSSVRVICRKLARIREGLID
jgi:hypothetical protein